VSLSFLENALECSFLPLEEGILAILAPEVEVPSFFFLLLPSLLPLSRF
jgi:hypothetical protein